MKMKVIVNGRRRAVGGGGILPPAAKTQDMGNTAENPTIIDPASAEAWNDAVTTNGYIGHLVILDKNVTVASLLHEYCVRW